MMKIYDKKLAYPYFIWMVLFTVVPLIIVVYYALTDGSGNFTIANLTSVSGYGSVFARSLLLALVATVICLVIAFPVGYFLSRLRVNKQHIMLMLVMLPMWMNFLLRTYAWMGLLSINGPVNAVLGFFGLGPYTMLNTSGAVVLGMVYNYVPYMILPLYTSMTKIDQSLVEAAQDLGASTTQTLFRVLIPHERARHQHRHHHGVRSGGVYLCHQPYAGRRLKPDDRRPDRDAVPGQQLQPERRFGHEPCADDHRPALHELHIQL